MVTAAAASLEVLVEEPSAEAALERLLPVLVPGHDFRIRVFAGKPDLLRNLPDRMRGYARRHDRERLRILVLVDEDREECIALKERMERAAADAGLVTRSSAPGGRPFTVLNRVVVEELEAWYLGDLDALRIGYPQLPPSLDRRRRFRDPDAVPGGTAEALLRELQRAGYFRGLERLPKVQLARQVAPHMRPGRNRSHSFTVFAEGLQALVGQ